MTGQQILSQARERIANHPFRSQGDGFLGGQAVWLGEVDEAVVAQWTADAAEGTPEQRRQIAYRIRTDLLNARKSGPVSYATMASLIDMLEE